MVGVHHRYISRWSSLIVVFFYLAHRAGYDPSIYFHPLVVGVSDSALGPTSPVDAETLSLFSDFHLLSTLLTNYFPPGPPFFPLSCLVKLDVPFGLPLAMYDVFCFHRET